MRNKKLLLGFVVAIAVAIFGFSGVQQTSVEAGKKAALTVTPQTLPFTQNWSNAGLITTDDTWTGVPGITGYRGDDLFTTIGGDISTLFVDGSATPQDVNANHADPDTFITGGITEFDGIANPVVALQGSGTADVPHIVIYLNTTGFGTINFVCNLRDIDNSADNAAQQINIQYRVGGTGDYANITGGYFADVSAGPSATQTTPVNITLPAAANNQPLVEVRVMTINATGSDEWIGVDDISVTGTPVVVVPADANADYDGDGKTDYMIARGAGPVTLAGSGAETEIKGRRTHNSSKGVAESPSAPGIQWYLSTNGAGAYSGYQLGDAATDFFIVEDFDGDHKDDVTVWREAGPGVAAFYILQSSTSTVRTDIFGQSGDDPAVVGDFDGDGKADPAVYRCPANTDPDGQCFFFYRASGGPAGISAQPWGFGVDGDFFPYVGDFDGDGKNDFCIQRANPTTPAQGQFVLRRSSDSGVEFINWGNSSDFLIPGDYDGDGKTDFCVRRTVSGLRQHFILERDGGTNGIQWGVTGDISVPGDYDGDGKTDLAVWRGNVDPNQNWFYIRRSSDSALQAFEWGQCPTASTCDFPVAGWAVH